MKTAFAGIVLCILSGCLQTGVIPSTYRVVSHNNNINKPTRWNFSNIGVQANSLNEDIPAGVILTIPRTKLINADAFIFEVTLTNADVFCASENTCMISLQVMGERNNSNVYLSKKVSDNHCTDLKVGESFASYLPAADYAHTHKETISVLYNTNTLKVFRNSVFITKMKYENFDKLGALKQVGIRLVNCGQVNQIKLFDARTGKILMKEEFKEFGQKDLHWYF